MAASTANQTPAGRHVMKYTKKLKKTSPNSKKIIGRMRERIKSKDHTIGRLRGQRNFLRRVAQVPVDRVQEVDGKEKEEPMPAKVAQERHVRETEDLLKSALRQIEKLQKQLISCNSILERERDKNLCLQAELQPTQEARAEAKMIGLTPVFFDEARFTTSPVVDTYACAIARQNALAIQVMAKFESNSTATVATEGTVRRKSLAGEAEDQGRFHFIRQVFSTRAYTV